MRGATLAALLFDIAATVAFATPLISNPTWLWEQVVQVHEGGVGGASDALALCSYILALVLVVIALATLVVLSGQSCGGGTRQAAKTVTSLERATLFFHLLLFAGLSLAWVYERVGVAVDGEGGSLEVWIPLACLGALTLVGVCFGGRGGWGGRQEQRRAIQGGCGLTFPNLYS